MEEGFNKGINMDSYIWVIVALCMVAIWLFILSMCKISKEETSLIKEELRGGINDLERCLFRLESKAPISGKAASDNDLNWVRDDIQKHDRRLWELERLVEELTSRKEK